MLYNLYQTSKNKIVKYRGCYSFYYIEFFFIRIEILKNQLNELILSNNLFSIFPNVIFTLVSLVTLDLRANQLTNIPDDIKKLKSIRELIISDNRLV